VSVFSGAKRKKRTSANQRLHDRDSVAVDAKSPKNTTQRLRSKIAVFESLCLEHPWIVPCKLITQIIFIKLNTVCHVFF
uniref:Uncharacterized protein n=1 Tax=Anopheles quadriannulatus TaxID=34691 RepID=A0A182X2I0_ANOQN